MIDGALTMGDPRLAHVTWKSANSIFDERMAEENAAFEQSKKFYEQFGGDAATGNQSPRRFMNAEHLRAISEGRRRQLAAKTI